jgi:hypothetical protein
MKNKVERRYSPRPVGDYAVQGRSGKLGYGMRECVAGDLAVWNLLWLSDPLVDLLLTWPPELADSAPLDSPLLQACIATAGESLGSAAMRDLVTELLPGAFAMRVTSEAKAARKLSLYKLLGVRWLRGLEVRAAIYRSRLESDGTVLHLHPATNLDAGPKLGAVALGLS